MKEKYKILDLFSGLGGFSLGLERTGHFETVAFCDNDKFSKLILDKHWKGIKVYDDVREITKEKFKEDGIEFPDIITGGFPCQPFSVAGKQQGTSDDRHLWPEMFRIIKAFKPRYVIGENVRGIVNIQDGVVFETVCTDLESEGYEVQPFIIPAAGVGAPHRRERVWIIANREESMVDSDNIRFQQHSTTKKESSWRGTSATSESTSNVSNTESERTGQNDEGLWQRSSRISGGEGTSAAEDVGNSEYNGSPTSEIGRRNEEINGGTEKKQNRSVEFKGTSGSEDNGNVSKENKNNVADTNNEGLRTRIGGSDNDHEKESRIGGADGEGGSSDVERNNSTSTEIKEVDVADTTSSRPPSKSIGDIGSMGEESSQEERTRDQSSVRTSTRSSERSENVADTESIGSDVGRREQHQGERSGQREVGGASGSNVANSKRIRQQGSREHVRPVDTEENKVRQTSRFNNGSQGEKGWWQFEPDVGRVAHGVSGRVHRLKGLGNSIVPQIVEEIGKAIIKAEKE